MKWIRKQNISFEAIEQEVMVMMLKARMVSKGRFISLRMYSGNKVSFKSEVQSLRDAQKCQSEMCAPRQV